MCFHLEVLKLIITFFKIFDGFIPFFKHCNFFKFIRNKLLFFWILLKLLIIGIWEGLKPPSQESKKHHIKNHQCCKCEKLSCLNNEKNLLNFIKIKWLHCLLFKSITQFLRNIQIVKLQIKYLTGLLILIRVMNMTIRFPKAEVNHQDACTTDFIEAGA